MPLETSRRIKTFQHMITSDRQNRMAKYRIRALLNTSSAARQAASLDTVEQDFERRLRIMLRHRWLAVISLLLLVVGLSVTAFYFMSQPARFRIAVGPAGSDDLRLVQFLATKFSKDNAPVRMRIMVTENSAQSAELVESGKADLAVVRHDLAFPRNGQVVAVLRRNYTVLFAPGEPFNSVADSKAKKPAATAAAPAKIENIEDLAGKRIGVIGRAQGNIELLKVILKQYDISSDKVQIVHLPVTDVGAAIREQKPDAILAVGPLSSRATMEAISTTVSLTPNKKPPIFLPIGASEAIAELFPAYESSEIAKGTFGGSPARPDEDIETVMVSHYIVASNATSDSAIGDLARLLVSSRQNLSSEMIGFAKIEKPNTEKDSNVTVHPGAKAYFDDEQKTFFDRYGDQLFWALMILPLFGSGLAGLATYMKAGERTQHLRLLNKLLDVCKRARRIETMDALERLQTEADELVIETVHRAERAALGESQLAFVLSIEQARSALAERRAILATRGPKRRK
jgi:TRAP transporter TAXI family solute receptor